MYKYPHNLEEGNVKIDGKLEAIESMVKFKRDDCLGHPVVLRFLNEKINSSRIQKWVILNVSLYMAFLFSLTAYSSIQSGGKEKPYFNMCYVGAS